MDWPIQVLPLGGLAEIGMNCMLVGHRDRWVLVDAGVQFPEAWEMGAERKLPDLDTLATWAPRVEAVVVTHGHEDHIGGLPWVLPRLDPAVPVWATPYTTRLIERRLGEHGLWDAGRMRAMTPGERFQAGPWDVEPIRVTHSIPDCAALALRCEDGTVVHTADWKVDDDPMDGEPLDWEAFERLGREGVDLLLSDSTNVLVETPSVSERTVARALLARIERHPGRVVVTQFASNLHRLTGLVAAAEATGRRLVFAGRSLWAYLRAAAQVGRAPIAPERVLELDAARGLDPDQVLLVTTGSQGERGAALQRAAAGEHPKLTIERDDLVLHSARVIPGNDANVFGMLNHLARAGAEVVYGRKSGIHASGHATQPELAELIRRVRPRRFVPIHGEFTFLRRHAELAAETGATTPVLAENGDLIGAGRGGAEILSHTPQHIYYNAGPLTGDADDMLLSERRRVAWNGVVSVACAVRRRPDRSQAGGSQSGRSRSGGFQLVGEATVQTRALFAGEGSEELAPALAAEVATVVESCPAGTPPRELTEALRLNLRRVCRRRLGKRPEVLVHLQVQAPAPAVSRAPAPSPRPPREDRLP